MSLATRCPECNTLFKVSLGQLQVREGQVRCGQCKVVFSGIDHLTAADSEVWKKAQFETNTESDDSADSKGTTNSPSFLNQLTKPKSTSVASRLGFAISAMPAKAKYAILTLIVVIFIQLTWVQRIPLITQLPGLASQISLNPIGQRFFVTPASQSLTVVGSGLDRLSTSQLQLEVSLQNAQTLPAHWPHLKVELLDTEGKPLAAKILSPGDYRYRPPAGRNAKNRPLHIAPDTTVEVQAILNTELLTEQLPGSFATGFKLTLYDSSLPLL